MCTHVLLWQGVKYDYESCSDMQSGLLFADTATILGGEMSPALKITTVLIMALNMLKKNKQHIYVNVDKGLKMCEMAQTSIIICHV